MKASDNMRKSCTNSRSCAAKKSHRKSRKPESRATCPRTLNTMPPKMSRETSKEDVTSDHINIGCTVKIKDLEDGEIETYRIVGSTESNSLMGKISNESPVGKALIGASVGDVVSVETPDGEYKYEVLEISKTSQG